MPYDSYPEMSFDEGSSAHSYEHFIPSFRSTSFDSPDSDLSAFISFPQELVSTTVQGVLPPDSLLLESYNPAPPRPRPRIIAPKPVKCKPAGYPSTLKYLESLVEPNLRHDGKGSYASRPMVGLNSRKFFYTEKKQLPVIGADEILSHLFYERPEICGPLGILGHMEYSSSTSVPFFPCQLPPGNYVPRLKTHGTYHSARFQVFKIPNHPSTEDIAQGSAPSLQNSPSTLDNYADSPDSVPSDMFPSPYSEVNTDIYAESKYSLPSSAYGFPRPARESLSFTDRQTEKYGSTMRLFPDVWPNSESDTPEMSLPRCSCVYCS